MVYHCLSIPYSPTLKEHSMCAFIQKVYKFCNEMTKRGHTVYHYGHKDSKVNCTEHITVTDDDVLKESYGDLNYWKTKGFNQYVGTKAFEVFNKNCINEINKRIKSKNEFILAWFGYGHEPCVSNFYDKAYVIEPSIGYDSMFAPYKIFETKSQMHRMHGINNVPVDFGKEFVVYPGFEKSDYEFKFEKSNTAVFLGRIVPDKGAQIVYDICNELDQDIYFLGANIMNLKDTKNCKFVGFANPETKKNYLRDAKFLFVPSLFIEPCNWTAIEAQFAGTPVICTDFGGFTETVVQGTTGFRCLNTNSIYQAIRNIDKINPFNCYQNAINNFTIEKQCNDYEIVFNNLLHYAA